jgi:hypothetical protein
MLCNNYFCYFAIAVFEDPEYRDALIKLEIHNELLVEKVSFLEEALSNLEQRYRLFRNSHSDCRSKIIVLHC